MITAMKSASDIWVCGRCRSINPLSRGRCYRCNTPIEVAAAKPEELAFEHHEVAPEPTGAYRPTESRAVITSLAVVAFIFATLVALWTNLSAAQLRVDEGRAASQLLLSSRLPLIALAPIAAAIALLSYGTWISRTVDNLPALGVGYSKVSSTWAFFEPLIPGFNFYAMPARMSEVIQKLGPHPSAMPLLGLAIILALVPALVAVAVVRFTGFFGTGAELILAASIAALAVFVFQSIALLIGLVVLWQIEGMGRARAEKVAGAPTP
jgi:hypothetical protein